MMKSNCAANLKITMNTTQLTYVNTEFAAQLL